MRHRITHDTPDSISDFNSVVDSAVVYSIKNALHSLLHLLILETPYIELTCDEEDESGNEHFQPTSFIVNAFGKLVVGDDGALCTIAAVLV